MIVNQNLMVPPSFAQILSGKIIEGKVFGDKKKNFSSLSRNNALKRTLDRGCMNIK